MRVPVCVALLAFLVPWPCLADAPVDFSGEWVVSGSNAADGDHSAPTDSPHSGAGPGMGGHGGHGGGGGMGGGHHGRQGQNAPGNADTTIASSANPRLNAHALIIRQSDVVFDVAANGQRTAYRFDNRNNYGAQYGGTVQLTWSAPEMIIETHPDAGGSVEEHYMLSPDGKHLTLRIREQKAGEDNAREFTRAFVRNADDASTAPATTLP